MRIHHILLFIVTLFGLGSLGAYPVKSGVLVQGYEKKISGTDINYESHVPGVRSALIARTTKLPQVIEWESEAVPEKQSSMVNFAFITGVSNIPGKISSDFNLYVNNDKLITFRLTNANQWQYKGKNQSELVFEQVYRDARDDRFGYMYFSIPSKYLNAGKPVNFRIEGTEDGINNWVMIFQSPIENKIAVNCTPGVLKNSNKQVIKVQYSHFGAPNKAVVDFAGVKQNENISFGVNNIELAIDPVREKTEKEVSITGKWGTIKQKVSLFPVKEWQVNFVQHTHTDIGYTRPQHEILSEHIRFIDYALDYCDLTDNYPEDAKFRWTCETAWSVSEYLRIRPKEQVERLKKRIKEGRIELTAMYFNFDELPGEQELAYSLYPLKLFKEQGLEVRSAMQNDVNGIAWSFSEFFPDLGIKYLIMGTHGHKALISFDKPTVFWWESPSGKKTLTFRAEHYNYGNFLQVEKGNFEMFEKRMLEYLNELDGRNYPHRIISLQYSGYFTDNSPPSTAGSDMIKQWNQKYTYPKLRMAVASEFMETIEKEYGNELQTFRAAWPDWWTDGFGSAAREAAIARYAQADMIANQIALSLAKLLGSEVPVSVNKEIDEANKALLFYGEHTFGFHGSIWDSFGKETMEQRSHKGAYAWESYRRSRSIGEAALGLLQSFAPRNKDKAGIVVYNPLNYTHSGTTVIYADHEILPIKKNTLIRDENGKEIKKQIIRSYADASYWQLWMDEVPALGTKYCTIEVLNDVPKVYAENKDIVRTVENQWYRIILDTETGVVTEWFDKELNKNLISENTKWKMGELIYERDDVRGALDRFKPGNFTRFSPTDIKYLGYKEGDIWDSYKFKGTSPAGMDKDNFTFELKLYKTCKQVDFTYCLKKKQETEPEAVYVVFPFELNNGKIFFDVPGGNIEAGVNQIPGSTNDWNTVQNFASVRNTSEQIVLCSKEIPLMQFGNINLGRFKAGATPESNHIFTWPMNNYWVTNFNADQHGEFEWTYNLTSSKDNSLQYATDFAWGNRIPLPNRVIPAGMSNNQFPIKGSILSITPGGIVLVNMKPIEGENAVILQLRETAGKESLLEISSAYNAKLSVKECNPLGETLPTSDGIKIKAWENKFVKLVW